MDGELVLALAQISTLNTSIPQLLSTVTLASVTASVTYTVVTPYPRVLCVWGATTNFSGAADQLYLQFNGDTGSHYLWEVNQANNSTVAGTTSGALMTQIQIGTITAATSTAGYWSSGSFIVADANQSAHFPTVVGQATAYATATNTYCGVYAGQYTPAAPASVTKLTLFPAAASFNAGSQFSFYGMS